MRVMTKNTYSLTSRNHSKALVHKTSHLNNFALQKLLHDCEHEFDLMDTAINFKKCSCLRIGQRFDVASANIARYYGETIFILEFILFVLGGSNVR